MMRDSYLGKPLISLVICFDNINPNPANSAFANCVDPDQLASEEAN